MMYLNPAKQTNEHVATLQGCSTNGIVADKLGALLPSFLVRST